MTRAHHDLNRHGWSNLDRKYTRADIDVGSNFVRVGNSIVIDGINQTTIFFFFLSFFLYFLFFFFSYLFQSSNLGQELLDRVFRHLNLLETAYFGLRYLDHGNQTVRNDVSYLGYIWSNTIVPSDSHNFVIIV